MNIYHVDYDVDYIYIFLFYSRHVFKNKNEI